MFLDELAVGDKAVIEELCDDCTCIKLIEMGCLPGEVVCMKIKSPFRGPMAIEVGGSIISMRKAEARSIRVKKQVA